VPDVAATDAMPGRERPAAGTLDLLPELGLVEVVALGEAGQLVATRSRRTSM
jgi:hypothetical protein